MYIYIYTHASKQDKLQIPEEKNIAFIIFFVHEFQMWNLLFRKLWKYQNTSVYIISFPKYFKLFRFLTQVFGLLFFLFLFRYYKFSVLSWITCYSLEYCKKQNREIIGSLHCSEIFTSLSILLTFQKQCFQTVCFDYFFLYSLPNLDQPNWMVPSMHLLCKLITNLKLSRDKSGMKVCHWNCILCL